MALSAEADAQADRYEYVVEGGQYYYVVDTWEDSRVWAGSCSNLGSPTPVDWAYISSLSEATWVDCNELAARLASNSGGVSNGGSDRYEYVVEGGQYYYVVDTWEDSRVWAGSCSNLGSPTPVDWAYISGLSEATWVDCGELANRLGSGGGGGVSNGGSDRYEYVVESGQYYYVVDTWEDSRVWAGGCSNLGTPSVVDWAYISGLSEATWVDCGELANRLGSGGGGGVSNGANYTLPTAGAIFDYQIGGDYWPAADVGVLSRDWFVGSSDPDRYSICYVNAFQTQPDGSGVRADVTSSWPQYAGNELLREFYEDPGWPGEKLINISTANRRQVAANHMKQILDECKRKGFEAVEFDNLDSWTRLTSAIPTNRHWDIADAAQYAKLLVDYTHSLGLAAAQKNTTDFFDYSAELGAYPYAYAGFDFVVSENCGRFWECQTFTNHYGGRVFNVEYPCESGDGGACAAQPGYANAGIDVACSAGGSLSVVIRDLYVRPSNVAGHVRWIC